MIAEFYVWLIYGLAATGAVFLVLFVWNLINAPFLIEREDHNRTRNELKGLKKVLGTDPLDHRKLKNRLVDKQIGHELKDVTFISAQLISGVLTIKEADNVTSCIDYGPADFGINFLLPLVADRITAVPAGDTPPFDVVEATDTSLRIKFASEPTAFNIQINGPLRL